MKTKFVLIAIIIAVSLGLANAQTTTIFFDDFNGSYMISAWWDIPTWVSSTDGTFVGRTQFRCSQNSPLPEISNSEARINIDTYNPTNVLPNIAFYGTDLRTIRTFLPGKGLIFTVRAKFNLPIVGGIVGANFLYDLTGSGSTHNEIDFEVLTNLPNEVHNNIYSDEPLGAGHPGFAPITNPITEYHTYVIKWLPNEISWSVDGNVIRTETTLIPDEPMHFHLNIWVPGAEWADAYDANLQPTNTPSLNQIYTMLVDYVKVDSLGLPTSIAGMQEVKDNFYPNPAHDLIYFNIPGKVNVSIYNSLGNMILNKRDITNGTLSITSLSPGTYILRCEQNGIVSNSKLIVY
jgi:hypothetical protein